LGLTALAYGIRFQNFGPDAINADSKQLYGIPSLTIVLVVLLLATLIGMGIAFLGLAYHHERRHREQLHELGAREREPSGLTS
jgi:hypothetical protein